MSVVALDTIGVSVLSANNLLRLQGGVERAKEQPVAQSPHVRHWKIGVNNYDRSGLMQSLHFSPRAMRVSLMLTKSQELLALCTTAQ